jgi:WhiB family redox-sensing transcriptional regulator
MDDGQRAACVGIAWDVRAHDRRVAPTEDELWDQAGRADGAMDASWLDQAACTHRDPEIFFPISPADTPPVRFALEVCNGCPVRVECLQAALADPRTAGIWGGTTETDRAAMHGSAAGRA